MFIGILGIIVSYSSPTLFVVKRKEEKSPNNTPDNANSPVLVLPMQLPVPPFPDGLSLC
jgi:hypothetical protein